MKKFLLICLAVFLTFSIVGNFTVSAAETVETQNISVDTGNAVLQVYGYSAGGANYMNVYSFDVRGTLIGSRNLEAGYVYSIPVVIGGHVEIELQPAKDFVLQSFSTSGDEMEGDKSNTHFNISVTSETGYASFIFEEIQKKVVVFDIRSFKGDGTLTFSTDTTTEKVFSKQCFYGGFVPSYEDIQKAKTPPPTMRASLQTTNPFYFSSPSLNALLRRYESLNKVYASGRYTATIRVSEDAYVEVNGEGKILSKNSTESFQIGKNYQVLEISVRFLGEPPHAAL